jgi:hypothetical protein
MARGSFWTSAPSPGIGGYKDEPWRLTRLANGDFLLVTEGEKPDWLPIAK